MTTSIPGTRSGADRASSAAAGSASDATVTTGAGAAWTIWTRLGDGTPRSAPMLPASTDGAPSPSQAPRSHVEVLEAVQQREDDARRPATADGSTRSSAASSCRRLDRDQEEVATGLVELLDDLRVHGRRSLRATRRRARRCDGSAASAVASDTRRRSLASPGRDHAADRPGPRIGDRSRHGRVGHEVDVASRRSRRRAPRPPPPPSPCRTVLTPPKPMCGSLPCVPALTTTTPACASLGEAHRAVHAGRVDRRREPVGGVVDERDRLVEVGDPVERPPRARRAPSREIGRVGSDAFEQRRCDVQPGRSTRCPPQSTVAPAARASSTAPRIRSMLSLRDHRAEEVGVVRADGQRAAAATSRSRKAS